MLQIDSLTKRYGNGTLALDDVSLQFERGVLGLLGANGAGKTTLMSIVATILRPTSGSVHWNGRDILADPVPFRRELGFLPQDFGVYEQLSAREYLAYLGRLKGLSGKTLKSRVEEALAAVNLQQAMNRRLSGYSGGIRQRVGIAQALLTAPRLLIVDEPTVGLDPEERLRFRNLLGDLARDRVVILSTHIVSDVEAIATTLAVMNKGKLRFFGSAERLIAEASGNVFRLVTTQEQLEAIRTKMTISTVQHRADGLHVRIVGEHPPAGSVAVEPTLEDAFLYLNRARNDVRVESAA